VPRFRYRALRQSGDEISGEVVAADEGAAASHLQSAGSLPIEIVPDLGRVSRALPRRGRGVGLSSREATLFTRQLASLLSAGVALDRALSLVAAGRGHPRRARLADVLLAAVNRGELLSRALAEHASFSRGFVTLVAAGEARGDIAGALERLAAVLERNRALTHSLANALIYPASVIVIAFVTISFLLGFVVPRFAVLLTSYRHEPPFAMRLLLGLANMFHDWGIPILLVLAVAVVGFALRWRDQSFRASVARRLMALPAIGTLLAMAEGERLAFLLGNMVAAGVALPTALTAASEAAANAAMQSGLAEAVRAVERGERLGDALGAIGLVPNLALEFVRVGEETGALAPMLIRASDILRQEIEATTTQWVALVAPLSMVVLGLIIGAIALALFNTVLEVYDIAS
jgi:general secretion pathway protein F